MIRLPLQSSPGQLDGYLRSHLIDPALLRGDKFEAFMIDRQNRLLALIEKAMGKSAYVETTGDETETAEADLDMVEAQMTAAAG